MSDDTDRDSEHGSERDLPDEIAALLARTDVWHEPPPGLENSVAAAIAAERTAIEASVAPVVPLQARRERRSLPWWAAAAAAVAVVVAGVVLVTRAGGDDPAGVEVALAATDLVPGASGSARFENTPAGLKIVLDADGLPGAGPDEMYEAWIGNGEIRISCGTFHLRGGDDPISLWAGTADPSFTTITVTREPLDGDPASSGDVVLRAEFAMPDGQ
jgi:hypothetical protein